MYDSRLFEGSKCLIDWYIIVNSNMWLSLFEGFLNGRGWKISEVGIGDLSFEGI